MSFVAEWPVAFKSPRYVTAAPSSSASAAANPNTQSQYLCHHRSVFSPFLLFCVVHFILRRCLNSVPPPTFTLRCTLLHLHQTRHLHKPPTTATHPQMHPQMQMQMQLRLYRLQKKQRTSTLPHAFRNPSLGHSDGPVEVAMPMPMPMPMPLTKTPLHHREKWRHNTNPKCRSKSNDRRASATRPTSI